MYKDFTVSGQPPIYDPDQFQLCCMRAGANTIFDNILSAMTDLRHSRERAAANRGRAVAIIYKLSYGLSQVCNWFQTDHSIFLKQANVNNEGLEIEQVMRGSCSKSKVNSIITVMSKNASEKINEIVNKAIFNEWQLIQVIDDYTTIHSIRRPQTDTAREWKVYVYNYHQSLQEHTSPSCLSCNQLPQPI